MLWRFGPWGDVCDPYLSKPALITAEIRVERSERPKPADFYDFLFMGVHSPRLLHSLKEAEFTLLLSIRPRSPPSQSPCWPLVT